MKISHEVTLPADSVFISLDQDYNNWLEDTRRLWHMPAMIPPIRSQSPTVHQTSHNKVHVPTGGDNYSPRTHATYESVSYIIDIHVDIFGIA